MRTAAIFLVLGVMLAGCDKAKNQARVKPPVRPGSATIHGVVKFVGTPPKMVAIPNALCGQTQEAIPEETILVGSGGGLQNCLVYLKGVSAAGGGAMPPTVLDQINCRYVPHVLAVMVGQNLVIRSQDTTPHNVHLQTAVNPTANFAFVRPGQETTTHFDYPEIFKVTCDVHPWMSAWVGVFSSPYFAVTDEHGRFEIKDVPAGNYSMEVWQERLGTKEQAIRISKHQNLEENFSYAPSSKGVGG